MRYEDFERDALKLAFETDLPLSPASVAHQLQCTVSEAKRHLETLLQSGALLLDSDGDGNLLFVLPERHLHRGAALDARSLALAKRRDERQRARLVTALNAVLPGAGSLMAGRTGAALGQAAVALGALATILAFWKDFGDAEHKFKLMLLIAGCLGAWLWALTTSLAVLRQANALPEGRGTARE